MKYRWRLTDDSCLFHSDGPGTKERSSAECLSMAYVSEVKITFIENLFPAAVAAEQLQRLHSTAGIASHPSHCPLWSQTNAFVFGQLSSTLIILFLSDIFKHRLVHNVTMFTNSTVSVTQCHVNIIVLFRTTHTSEKCILISPPLKALKILQSVEY